MNMTIPIPSLENVTVSKLFIHPIKSCKGISVEEVEFTPVGVKYDRNWSIIDATKDKVLTLREVPKLALVHPVMKVDKDVPGEGTMTVTFPEDSGVHSFDVPLCPNESTLEGWKKIDSMILFTNEMDGYIAPSPSRLPSLFSALIPLQLMPTPSSILSSFLGREVHLVFKGPKPRLCDPTESHPDLVVEISQQDGYPLHLLGEESVEALEGQTRKYVGQQGVEEMWFEEKLVIERFRPNIITKGAEAYAEDSWEEIVFEPADENDRSRINPNIALVSKCTRCLLPNVDPTTGIRDKAVPFKIMMKSRAGLAPENMRSPCMGINGVPDGNGKIKVGDRVRVTKVAKK